MTTQKDYTSGTDTNKVAQWDRSGGSDTHPNSGDDTKKTGNEPHPKAGNGDPKKM